MANQLKEFLESNKNLNQTEQIVSSGVGSALIALGIQNLKKSPVLACTSIATGAYFLFRSATAYCMVKDVLQKENWLNEEYEPEDFY